MLLEWQQPQSIRKKCKAIPRRFFTARVEGWSGWTALISRNVLHRINILLLEVQPS